MKAAGANNSGLAAFKQIYFLIWWPAVPKQGAGGLVLSGDSKGNPPLPPL